MFLKNLKDSGDVLDYLNRYKAQPTVSSVPQEGPKDTLLFYHKEKIGEGSNLAFETCFITECSRLGLLIVFH